MEINKDAVERSYRDFSDVLKSRVDQVVEDIVKTKRQEGKVVAILGSGPNLHEGITTLVAELMQKGIIDGVSTSSAVINHEMSGTLEKVKRIDGEANKIKKEMLPRDGIFEVTILSPEMLEQFQSEIAIDMEFYKRMLDTKGNIIVKVAGNMAYPSGLRVELLAKEVLQLSRQYGIPFEQVAGYGADPMTMIGAGARLGLPVLVTVPQLVGGGEVGLAIGDSIPISERSLRIAKMLDSADIIIESAIALSQEIHDGPFETYTGHGIWSAWDEKWTYSLEDKKIVRIDLDVNLERAWMMERENDKISMAVDRGQPKTKMTGIPFRMEMSGFARIPGSIPLVGDIGNVWPVLASRVADVLNIKLDFMSYNQSTEEGKEVREWIVDNVRPVDRKLMIRKSKSFS